MTLNNNCIPNQPCIFHIFNRHGVKRIKKYLFQITWVITDCGSSEKFWFPNLTSIPYIPTRLQHMLVTTNIKYTSYIKILVFIATTEDHIVHHACVLKKYVNK